MTLNIFTWPPFIAAFLNAGLAVVALWRHPRSHTVRPFVAFNLAMVVWQIATLQLFTISDPDLALQSTQWARNIIVFIPTFFFHMVLSLIRNESKSQRRLLWAAYFLSAIFMISNNIDGLFVKSVQRSYWGFYPVAGPLGVFYPLHFFACIIYASVLFYRGAQETTGFRRNQCRFLLMATFVFFGSAMSNFLDVLGWSIYPFANVMSIVYSLLIAYAVVTFGLVDIRMAFRKGIVYLSMAGALTCTYVLIESLIKRMFLENDTLSTTYAFHLAAVPFTLAMAPRMRSAIEPLVQRMPFWRSRDHEKIVREFGQAILAMLDLQQLANSLVTQLGHIFDIEEAAFYVWPVKQETLECRAWMGHEPPVLTRDHVAIMHLLKTRKPIYRERLLWETEDRTREEVFPELIRFVRTSKFHILMPLFFRTELVGILALGPKRSQDMYNADDFDLLETMVGQMAVAVSNARAIQTIQEQKRLMEHQREMVFMGTLATEMAHELTKPLTHIMNAGSRLDSSVRGTSRENLKTIEKEAQRASEILDGFAMLSPDRTLHRITISIADLLQEAMETLGLNEDKAIKIIKHFEILPSAKVNPGQIVQVFTNVIQNAWQAMPKGGSLTISLNSIHMDGQPPELEVSITDTGYGVPAEIQEKVFDPFFTTKRAKGGRGMGLTISRAMVERHGGHIRIQSPVTPAGGTRVVIRLPL